MSWTVTGGTILSSDNGTSGSPLTASSQWQAPTVEGIYTVSVYVADSGSFMCGGRQSIQPTLDVQVSVSSGQPPVIQSLTANPVSMAPGETATLTCLATDPEAGAITYTWSSDKGIVTPVTEGTATFTTTELGISTITCTATDPDSLFIADTVGVSVTSVAAEREIRGGFESPLRVAVDSMGTAWVVDRGVSGITAIDLFSGEYLYDIALKGANSVDVDWNGDLLVGGPQGAVLVDRLGQVSDGITFNGSKSRVADVAVDLINQRYGVLHRGNRVVLYDSMGTQITAFGTAGDSPEQFKGPRGLAVTPQGSWVVADTGHGMIKIFDSAGNLLNSFGDIGGGAGEFVRLEDVAVDEAGIIYASDSYQDWIQSFDPDGTPREVFGTYGDGLGQFKTLTGVTVAKGFNKVVAASIDTGSLQVFATAGSPVGPPPEAQIVTNPGTLNFPDQPLQTRSPEQVIELRNDGTALVGIRAISTEGDFAQVNNCVEFLGPSQSCLIQVTFEPTEAGPETGFLHIDTSVAPGRTSVALDGNGFTQSQVTLLPAQLTFADQSVMTVSNPQLVTLANTGSAPVVIGQIATSGEFQQTNDCAASVAAGASCTIAVSFAPVGTPGPRSGNLAVTTNASGSPHLVSLLGQATDLVIQITIDDTAGLEGDGAPIDAPFTVTLSAPSPGGVSVDFATRDDTALAGEDYTAVSGTLTFAQGETDQQILVPILGDTVLEPEEEVFYVDLSNAVGATISRASGIATITDEEICAGPNLLANASAEDRPTGSGIPDWAVIQGTGWQQGHYPPTAAHGLSYFFAGDSDIAELEQMIDVSAYSDVISDGDLMFAFNGWIRTADESPTDTARIVVEYLDYTSGAVLDSFDTGELSNSTDWEEVLDLRAAPSSAGWIRVRLIAQRNSGTTNDAMFDGLALYSIRVPTLVISDFDDYEGGDGTSFDALFDVALACDISKAISVDFATRGGTALPGEDYQANSGTLTFAPGETLQQVPVTVFGDSVDEDHETFFVDLSGTTANEAVLVDDEGFGLIVNDDACTNKAAYWKSHSFAWPVSELELGGVWYDEPSLIQILGYTGNDEPAEVARELAATKLNLAVGSDPSIVPTVVEADDFLESFPIGSDPDASGRAWARDLINTLKSYNGQKCQ